LFNLELARPLLFSKPGLVTALVVSRSAGGSTPRTSNIAATSSPAHLAFVASSRWTVRRSALPRRCHQAVKLSCEASDPSQQFSCGQEADLIRLFLHSCSVASIAGAASARSGGEHGNVPIGCCSPWISRRRGTAEFDGRRVTSHHITFFCSDS